MKGGKMQGAIRWSLAETPVARERFYRSILPVIRREARRVGFAVGVHGSMRRDMDLIAVPWVKRHAAAKVLAQFIFEAVTGLKGPGWAMKDDGKWGG